MNPFTCTSLVHIFLSFEFYLFFSTQKLISITKTEPINIGGERFSVFFFLFVSFLAQNCRFSGHRWRRDGRIGQDSQDSFTQHPQNGIEHRNIVARKTITARREFPLTSKPTVRLNEFKSEVLYLPARASHKHICTFRVRT